MSHDSTVKKILETATQRLTKAGCETPGLDAEVLLAHTLNKERIWLYTYPQQILAKNHLDKFYQLLERREQREPVAYLTGHKEFFGLDFRVNRHVLIPRPETELLVETTIEIVNRRQLNSPLIADIGTGSGCIAIALANNIATAILLAIDVSAEALQVARQNAGQHGVVDKIEFLLGDLVALPGPVDIIVSNPPYVSQPELKAVSPEVNQYEPELALKGGDDGLEIIRQLLTQARQKLKSGGSLLVEIGATQGSVVTHLAKRHFPEAKIYIKKDLADLDRLLVLEQSNV